MSEKEKKQFDIPASRENLTNQAKGLAKFFQIDLTIRIFGVVVYELHYPPQNS